MKTALIGYTGFVGGNILRQAAFDDVFHSKNIADIRGKKYDLIVCAGAPAAKWIANQHPDEDWKNISLLISHLKTVTTKQCVLISTVDVYPKPIMVDEDSHIDTDHLHPYGKHRRLLEEFVTQQFPAHTVVRLPALFGPGLKKNFIYDLIHAQLLDKMHPDSTFQFYNIEYIWRDIQRVLAQQLPIINITSHPITAQSISHAALNLQLQPAIGVLPVTYNVLSRYANALGGQQGYLYDAKTVTAELITFILEQRMRSPS